jgi:hypothetical protein
MWYMFDAGQLQCRLRRLAVLLNQRGRHRRPVSSGMRAGRTSRNTHPLDLNLLVLTVVLRLHLDLQEKEAGAQNLIESSPLLTPSPPFYLVATSQKQRDRWG